MRLTKQQLKQIIKEELALVLELGFGQGKPAPDKWSKKQEIVLEEEEELEEEKKKKKTKGNPWAICTSSVGRKDKAKYERCVKKVKKKINENLFEEEISYSNIRRAAPLLKNLINIRHEILPGLMADFKPLKQKLGLEWADVWRDWDWKADLQATNLGDPRAAWGAAFGRRFKKLNDLRLGVKYTGKTGGRHGPTSHRVMGTLELPFE